MPPCFVPARAPAHRRPLSIAAFGLALMMTACSGGDRSERSEALLESGFHRLIADGAAGIPPTAAVFCIGLGAVGDLVDPPPRVLGAIVDPEIDIRPASDCSLGSRAYETLTGRPAVIFHIRDVDCAPSDRCTFRGGWSAGNLGAFETRYLASRRTGRWAVERDPAAPESVS